MMEIRTVAVIGAGPQGRSIAQRAALAGYRTILVDILPANLRQAYDEMRNRVEQEHTTGLSPSEANATIERLELASSLAEAAREADLVIECVPDEMESKLEIFTLLDKVCRPQTILASTTTSLSIGEIASITFRAAKVLGMRFCFGSTKPKARVGLVRSAQTSDETFSACAQAASQMVDQLVSSVETAPS